ncbi:MAG: EVE domain-containing protein [Luteitalea sp.]|nr:EVE domain-containing protein [Luteitalea sp.]
MAAMNWLFKEEPANYAFDLLVKDRKTTWTGVKNPLAQKHLRAVKRGDQILYYHTGDQRAVVAIAKALGDAYPDPGDATGKHVVVDVGPVKRLPRPVTLAEIKADPAFGSFALVRMSRLSVMPVTDDQWDRIVTMADGPGKAGR